jgi:ATP-dependent DNA helicase DinG
MPKRAKENAQIATAAAPAPLERMQSPTDESDVKEPTIAEIFGPGGALERYMPAGYEHRPSQLEMAELVEAAFQEKRHLIVEAGTGTGKTLAYLIPAIRSGRRVVISTATKSLQEQLFEKDIPFLQKYFAPKLKVAVMKGRNNFLCPRCNESKVPPIATTRYILWDLCIVVSDLPELPRRAVCSRKHA